MDNARITELEIRMEYQDQTIGQLNDVVVNLRNEVDALRAELDKLRTKIEDGDHRFGPANEKPPHY